MWWPSNGGVSISNRQRESFQVRLPVSSQDGRLPAADGDHHLPEGDLPAAAQASDGAGRGQILHHYLVKQLSGWCAFAQPVVEMEMYQFVPFTAISPQKYSRVG